MLPEYRAKSATLNPNQED